MRIVIAGVAALCVLLSAAPPSLAQAEPPEGEFEPTVNWGLHSGFGFVGQFGMGWQFQVLGQRPDGWGAGAGVSYLLSAHDVFVPTFNTRVFVGGMTVLAELVGRFPVQPQFELQTSLGVGFLQKGGRFRNVPVALLAQGPYVGFDVRYHVGPEQIIYGGARASFFLNAQFAQGFGTQRESVPLARRPLLLFGFSWAF